MKATGPSAGDAVSDNDDIAKLLRALNDEIRNDRNDPGSAAADHDDEDEDGEPHGRRMPYGKIALALLAAAGIGLAVVVLDESRSVPPAGGVQTAIPSQTAETLAAPPALNGGVIRTAPTPPPAGLTAGPAQPMAPAAAPSSLVAPMAPSMVSRSGPPEGLIARPGGNTPTASAPLQTQTVPIPSVPPPTTTMVPVPPTAAPPLLSPPLAGGMTGSPPPVAVTPVTPPSEAPRNAVAAIPPADTAALQAALAPKVPARTTPAKPAKATPEEPAAGHGAPDGKYAVQVGTFRDASNADSLLHKLNSHGFRAYAVDWTDQNAQSWRAVRVGGYDSQNDARRLVAELKTKLGIGGYVVSAK